MLCNACFDYYRTRGTLERQRAAPDPGIVKRCTYEGCRKPDESREFHKIGDHITAGGRDWSSLYGQVLCDACCLQYLLRGTLERVGGEGDDGGEEEDEMESEDEGGNAGHERRCTYEGCPQARGEQQVLQDLRAHDSGGS